MNIQEIFQDIIYNIKYQYYWSWFNRKIIMRINYWFNDPIKPGTFFENCSLHPLICISNDYEDDNLTGWSLITNSSDSCSRFHCGIIELTQEQATNIQKTWPLRYELDREDISWKEILEIFNITSEDFTIQYDKIKLINTGMLIPVEYKDELITLIIQNKDLPKVSIKERHKLENYKLYGIHDQFIIFDEFNSSINILYFLITHKGRELIRQKDKVKN